MEEGMHRTLKCSPETLWSQVLLTVLLDLRTTWKEKILPKIISVGEEHFWHFAANSSRVYLHARANREEHCFRSRRSTTFQRVRICPSSCLYRLGPLGSVLFWTSLSFPLYGRSHLLRRLPPTKLAERSGGWQMDTNLDFVFRSTESASLKFLVGPAVDDYNSSPLSPEEVTASSYSTVGTRDTATP